MLGTYSKWVRIREQQIIAFQTAMTGELFALLTQQSTLTDTLGQWCDEVFVETIAIVKSQLKTTPRENVIGSLFQLRAQFLLQSSEYGIAKLSAMLIHAELMAMQSFWQENEVILVGTKRLSRLYALALEIHGIKSAVFEDSDLTLQGLISAYRMISSSNHSE